jgi:hypothetical protein
MAAIDLPEYASQIKEYGYDRMPALYGATEAEIVEMMEDAAIQIKKPHRRLFITKWKELLAAVTGHDGDEPKQVAVGERPATAGHDGDAPKQVEVGERDTHVTRVTIGTYHKTGTNLFNSFSLQANQLPVSPPDGRSAGEGQYMHRTIRFERANHMEYMKTEEVHDKCVVSVRHPLRVILSGARYHMRSNEGWLIEQGYKKQIWAAADPVLFEMRRAAKHTIDGMYADKKRLGHKCMWVHLECFRSNACREQVVTQLATYLGMDSSYSVQIATLIHAKARAEYHSMDHNLNPLSVSRANSALP